MDRTSWKPKVFKATENVDYKANENWKDVADKFYKEELNKDKKSAGESWQKSGEAYFVEWGYDLDYDFAEIDDIDDAKQLAKDNGGNVYLDDKLVYSVIPSIKKDPTNDKSKFIVSNNLMGVESKSDKCSYCGKGRMKENPEQCSGCGDVFSSEAKANEGMGEIDPTQLKKIVTDNFDTRGSGMFMFCNHCNHMIENKFGVDIGSFMTDINTQRKVLSHMMDYHVKELMVKEGFYQGLHGYVDAKCKTCGGLEFGSIEDMNDHFAMNSDHISNLDDLDSKIPNSD